MSQLSSDPHRGDTCAYYWNPVASQPAETRSTGSYVCLEGAMATKRCASGRRLCTAALTNVQAPFHQERQLQPLGEILQVLPLNESLLGLISQLLTLGRLRNSKHARNGSGCVLRMHNLARVSRRCRPALISADRCSLTACTHVKRRHLGARVAVTACVPAGLR